MGQSTFPVPSSGSSTSTVLPVNASSVILDGSLTSGTSYTTTVNGNGGPAYLVASVNAATITIGGTAYTVLTGNVVSSKAFGASTSVTVAVLAAPAIFNSSVMPNNSNWDSVAYGLISATNYYVALANSTTTGAYSTDGKTWSTLTMPSSSYQGITFGNSRFMAVGYNDSLTSGIAAYSTNGTTWTASTPAGTNILFSSVAYGLISATNYYVAIGNLTTTFIATSQGNYSTNGTSWSSFNLPSSQNWLKVTFGNGKFVAVTSNSADVAYSTNGTTWTASTTPNASGCIGITYGLVGATPTYVAVSSGTTVGVYSTNGTSWSASTMPSASSWTSVTYGNGYFVATATGTTAGAFSTNGSTWTAGTMPSASKWYGVTYGNGYFVAVASGTTAGAYFSSGSLPVNFGIYAGPTTVN